jgi:hypothetical protein
MKRRLVSILSNHLDTECGGSRARHLTKVPFELIDHYHLNKETPGPARAERKPQRLCFDVFGARVLYKYSNEIKQRTVGWWTNTKQSLPALVGESSYVLYGGDEGRACKQNRGIYPDHRRQNRYAAGSCLRARPAESYVRRHAIMSWNDTTDGESRFALAGL